MKFLERHKHSLLITALVVILLLLASLIYISKVDKYYSKINGIATTRTFYQNLEKYYQFQDAKNKVNKTLSSYADTAKNAIISNNAYVSEAKIAGIDYSQAATDKYMKQFYDNNGGKEQYYHYVSTQYGESKEIANYINQTKYLKYKLETKLFSTNEFSGVIIRWDIFEGLPENIKKQDNAKAQEILQNQFLPLFKSGTPAAEIEKNTDFYKFSHGNQMQNSIALESSFMTLTGANSEQEVFNSTVHLNEGQTIWSQLKNLTKVGDVTPVFKTDVGVYAIYRLDSQKSAKYANEQYMMDSYNKSAVFSDSYVRVMNNLKTIFTKPFALINNLIFGKVYAYTPPSVPGTGCFADIKHQAWYTIQFIDENSGNDVIGNGGGSITQTTQSYYDAGCGNPVNSFKNDTYANGGFTLTINGTNITETEKLDGANKIFYVNCLSGTRSASFIAPTGYAIDSGHNIQWTDTKTLPLVQWKNVPYSSLTTPGNGGLFLLARTNGLTTYAIKIYVKPTKVDNSRPSVTGTASCSNKDIQGVVGYDGDLLYGVTPKVAYRVDGGAWKDLIYSTNKSLNIINMASIDQTISHTVDISAADYWSDYSVNTGAFPQAITVNYGPCAVKVSGKVGYYYTTHPSYQNQYYKNLSGINVAVYVNTNPGTWYCTTTNSSGAYSLSNGQIIPKNQYFAVRIYSKNSPNNNFCSNDIDANFGSPFTDYMYPGDNQNPLTDTHYTCNPGGTAFAIGYEQQRSLGSPLIGTGACKAGTPTIASNSYNFVFPYTPPIVSCVSSGGTDTLVGQNATITGSIKVNSGQVSGISFTNIRLVGSNLSFSDKNGTGTAPGNISFTTNSTNPLVSAGTYGTTFTASGGILPDAIEGSITCPTPGSFPAHTAPFFSTIGGDVIVGSKIGALPGSCKDTSPDPDGILAWNTNSDQFNGSGTTMAAQALGQIIGFVSGQQGGATSPGNNLTFANVNTSGGAFSSPIYGGLFGAAPCGPDLSSYGSMTPSGNPGTISSVSSGTKAYNSNLQISSLNIINGTQATIYTTGDVFISGDIKYNTTGWIDLSKIPNLKIIAKNIYIAPGVHQLDGVFIATQDIKDCADFSRAFQDQSCYGIEANPNTLTVNGSFMANQIYLERTGGNIYQTSTIPSTPAEIFNYTPENWLAPVSTLQGQITSFNTLSPIL